MNKLACACFILGAVLANGPTLANEGLDDNISVTGSLECEVGASVLLLAEERHPVRCDFESANVRDNLNRYLVTLTGVDGGIGAGEGAVLSWTVIRLGADEEAPSSRGSISGSYARIQPSIAEQHGLDASALIGGAQMSIALEPRSQGRNNAAGAISSLEISF